MKLLRFGEAGRESWGLRDPEGNIRNLADALAGMTAAELTPEWLHQLAATDATSLPFLKADRRIGPAIPRPLNFVCIGLNYADHAAETGGKIPAEPIIFLKSLSAFSGPYDDIVIPRGAKKTDWEVELGVVIGTKARYVPGKCRHGSCRRLLRGERCQRACRPDHRCPGRLSGRRPG
jgi:2-keto-4-pentenoate hydratase/2-oxohepta-3-ene-1,7-dioic acid hydratase in catechol pathway